VNAALALCRNGDVLKIPPGTVTWNSQLNLGPKLIWIIGAGTNSTTIVNGYGDELIKWAPNTASTVIRLSGITFQQSYGRFYLVSVKGPSNMRIDHCRFLGGEDVISWNFAQSGTGRAIGVVDHNEFLNCRTAYRVFDQRTTDGGTPGLVAWSEPIITGTTNVPVFEDNLFHMNSNFSQTGDSAQFYGQYGGRVVIRHNRFGTSAADSFKQNWIDAHGDSPGYSVILYEVYNNDFHEGNQGSLGAGGSANARGGMHIYFGNTYTTTTLQPMHFFDDTGGIHRVKDTFYWNNAWNGSSGRLSDQINNETPSIIKENINYILRPILSGDVWYPYTPLSYPHPIVTAQDGGGEASSPVITSPLVANGTQGQSFNYQIAAANAPTSFGVSALPPGLSVSTGTGAISGAPQTNGTFNVTIFASNAYGIGSAQLTLTISPSKSQGNVIVVTSPTASAINAAIASASDGDTIRVNATGTVTWTETVTLPSTKGITLIGPGTNTPKGSASFPLVVVSAQKPAIAITSDNNRASYRVSGFKFQNPNLSSDFSGYWYNSFISVRGRGKGKDGLGAYRIDNNYFDHVGNDTTIGLDGSTGVLTGLTDNNTFQDVGQNTVVYGIRIRETWKGQSSSCYGYDAWQRPFAFGTADFHFIEDNLFSRLTTEGRHDVSCDGAGGKYVVRFNTFNRSYNSGYQMDYIDAHGDGSPGLGTGTRGGEIYGNVFQGSGSAVGRDISLRGGEWLIHSNTFPAYAYIALTEYRASSSDYSQLDSPSICNTGVPQFAGSGDFATWYPLPGQIRGTYFWRNIYNGANVVPDVAGENYVPTYISANRDYWVSATKPAVLGNYTPFAYPHPMVARVGQGTANPITQVTPATLGYEVSMGSSSSQTVAIHNAGQGTLTGTVSLSTTSSPSPWSIVGATKYTNDTTITVRYAPTSLLDSSATLTLSDNGGGATVSLSGTSPKLYIECVGDSLTRGGASSSTNFVPGGYRLPLYQMLTDAGINVAFTGSASDNSAPGLPYPQHDGFGGFEIGDIAASYPDYAAVIHAPDYVLLQCGLNDFRHNNAITQATNRLAMLISEIAATFPNANILVADMNPWDNLSATNAAMNVYYNQYIPNIVSNQKSSGNAVYLADMRQPYLTVDDVMPGDNTHFAQSGYIKMARMWANLIVGIQSGAPAAPVNLRIVQLP